MQKQTVLSKTLVTVQTLVLLFPVQSINDGSIGCNREYSLWHFIEAISRWRRRSQVSAQQTGWLVK